MSSASVSTPRPPDPQRKYVAESADLTRVSLRHNILEFAAAPLTYARGLWKRKTFEALQKLTGIILAAELRDVVHKDLFPSLGDTVHGFAREKIGCALGFREFSRF